MIEEWRPVDGYEGLYEVSSLGRVKSLPRLTHLGRPVHGVTEPVIMAGSISRGYRHVNLARNGRKRMKSIHRMVAAAFLGPCPAGKQVNHKNFIRHDNRIDNLEYLTKSEDEQHKRQAGRGPRGESHPSAKLNEFDVREILCLKGKVSGPMLTNRYGVTHHLIYLIWRRQVWTCVSA